MYQIFWGDFLLHDLRLEDYFVINPKLREELNKVSELNFDISPTHRHFNKLEVLVSNIIVKKNSKTIFKGRIINEKINMNNSKQVTCESVLAFLFDSVIRPYSFQGLPEDLFMFFINSHNTQVGTFVSTTDTTILTNKTYFKYNDINLLYEQVLEPVISEINTYYESSGDKLLFIGKMTGANLDNNDYINRNSSNYINTFETIEEKLLKTIGGYIQIRYEENGDFIDWVDDFTIVNSGTTSQIVSAQTIEFGENLIDITAENVATETYSVVIPLGAEIEEEKDEEIEEVAEDVNLKKRLTIESINDGKDYLVNEMALAKYGWIVAPIEETTWDDVTVASNLKIKGEKFLNNQAVMLKSTLELNALDLNIVDGSIDDFKMGEYIKVQSTPHNLSKTYLLTKKETPLTKPESMTVTLGETKNTLTGIQIGSGKDTINKIENILGDYVLNDNVTQIINESIENNSIIQQLPNTLMSKVEEIYSSKSDLEELLQIINTKLTQTSEDWTFEFEKIIQQITNVDGTVNSNYQELIKYIRFVDGKIVLGEVGNDITLELKNDRLSFFNKGMEVAYVSNGRIYITDAEFTHSMILGNFGFIPRANGNLSFKKVKGDN